MDSSVIFLVVIGVWAAYLVPHWLRRREDLSASRSVDRFSAAMRVLTRRPAPTERPERPRTSAYVLAPTQDLPALEAGVVVEPVVEPEVVPEPGPGPEQAAPRHAVRTGSRPRRRVPVALLLAVLVLGLLAVATLAGLALAGLVPAWSPAPAAGVVLVLVVGLRASARRRRRATRAVVPAAAVTVVDHRADPAVDAPAAAPEAELFDEAEHTALEEQVRIRRLAEEALRAADVPYREPEPGEWTPVAVPLPAYLLKPHARPAYQGPAAQPGPVAPSRRPDVDEDDIPTYAPPPRRVAGA